MRSKILAVLLATALLSSTVLLPWPAAGADQPAATEEEASTVELVLRLTEELQRWLSSLPAERQAELRPRIAALLGTLPQLAEPAAESTDSAGRDQAIAAQPSPGLDLPVAPAAADGEPTVAEPAAVEAAESTPESTQAAAEPKTRAEPPTASEPPAAVPTAAGDAADLVEPADLPATPPPAAPRRRGCRTLVPFDTDGDDKLTGLDRYWRHFYLWTDVDGDGDVDEREVESPYERGIREVSVDLRAFVRGKGKRKRSLEIRTEEHILLDIGGDGWSGVMPRGDDGALAIDATAVRQAGGPDLRDSRGVALEGIRPFRPGWKLLLGDGSELLANCPR